MSARFAQDAHDNFVQLKQSLPLDGHGQLKLSIDRCLTQLASHFDFQDRLGSPVSSQAPQGQLKCQKDTLRKAVAEYEKELPTRADNRICDVRFVRVGLSKPTLSARCLADFLQQFPTERSMLWAERQLSSLAVAHSLTLQHGGGFLKTCPSL